MVSGRGQGADSVVSSGKAPSDVGRETSLAITSVVDSLEESELVHRQLI